MKQFGLFKMRCVPYLYFLISLRCRYIFGILSVRKWSFIFLSNVNKFLIDDYISCHFEFYEALLDIQNCITYIGKCSFKS